MDAEEREIYYYLKGQSDQFVPANAISRYAGGKQKYKDSPHWAKPVLDRMVERGILDLEPPDTYRLRPVPKPAQDSSRWVSPQVAEILKRSGRKFGGVAYVGDTETYYDSL